MRSMIRCCALVLLLPLPRPVGEGEGEGTHVRTTWWLAMVYVAHSGLADCGNAIITQGCTLCYLMSPVSGLVDIEAIVEYFWGVTVVCPYCIAGSPKQARRAILRVTEGNALGHAVSNLIIAWKAVYHRWRCIALQAKESCRQYCPRALPAVTLCTALRAILIAFFPGFLYRSDML